MPGQGQTFGDLYRTVSEARLLECLRLEGYAHISDPDIALRDATFALSQWIKDGLSFREKEREGRHFDPVEVICHMKSAGRLGRDDVWQRCFVTTLRRFVSDQTYRAGSHVKLDYARRFYTPHVAEGQSLRLRLPLPLAGRYTELDIEPVLPVEATAHRLSDGRLEVRATATKTARLDIGARLSFKLPDLQTLPAPESFEPYLKAKDGLVVVTSKIAALSQHLAGDATAERALASFWDYLMDNFQFNPLHYDQIPAEAPLDWVMETGSYDCQLASAFFVALCRARGLPARLTGGHFLYPLSPTNHYWAEVWLESNGWTPFDFLSWDLSSGGTDASWRNHFFGQLDARLVTECLPHNFTGPIGVPIPPVWHILRSMTRHGVEITFTGLDGPPVYEDRLALL